MARVVRSLLRLVVALAGAGALLAAALGAIVYSANRLVHDVATAYVVPLPNLVTQAQVPSVIYAANGAVLATLRSSLNRQPVALGSVSPILVTAVLDTEDHSFWLHGGMDVESTIRALFADVSAGSAIQGGSTITQQLVKDTYLTDQKTLSRKVREAVLAERLEGKYTKGQILDAYLNTVYLGNGAYGVEAAAREYFNEGANHVDLAQAALLAGLIQAPSGYDPLVNPEGARHRRSEVLSRMVYYGSATPAAAAVANNAPLPTKVRDAPGISYTTYGYYVEQVVGELLDNPALGATADEREAALFSGGLRIYTNEVPSLQAYAQNVATNDIATDGLRQVAAAFAVIDPYNGNVEALIGGPSTGSQFDDATQGLRQPGSGFKLFSLVGALERGYDVYDSILGASPCAIQFPGVPESYGYSLQHPLNNDAYASYGAVSLVEATAESINCAFLRLAHEVTLTKVVDVARSMGVSDATLNPANPSLVIGTEAVRPVEMAAAYATVADGGIYHNPTFVKRVLDRTGTVIYNGETTGRRVFSQEVADEAIVALRATVEYGTGTAAALPNAEVAGKTGTTTNSVDAWFNGITPTLVTSVWLGNPKGEVPMYYADGAEVFGAGTPTQIWHDVMAYALKDVPYSAFPAPEPSLLPAVQYIDSPALARDDLISHGYVPPPPTTTTTTKPQAGSRHRVAPTTTTVPATTTTPIPVTTRPRSTTTPPTAPRRATTAPSPHTSPPPTLVPTTHAPTTHVTTIHAPTTHAPTTHAPTTHVTTAHVAPTTTPTTHVAPTTAPTTHAPTTHVAPTTAPTTHAPTTHAAPTTAASTTAAPTTAAPTTAAPTTAAPTTAAPTTAAPTTSSPPPTTVPATVAPTTPVGAGPGAGPTPTTGAAAADGRVADHGAGT